LFASIALIAAPVVAQAQAVLTERSVSLQLARVIADAALAQCKKDGFDVTVSVVDRAGLQRLLMRADSASPHNAELARRKAYTSRTFKMTSLDWEKRTEPGMPLAGQRQLADVIPLGGGVPILIGADAIGGVGVSGSTSQEQDEKCARAGVTAAASLLR
jgi:uncharacterized protein GlcG (DUF336 family)